MTLENLCAVLKIQTRKESEWQSVTRCRHRAEQHGFLMFGRSRTGERPDLLPICHHDHTEDRSLKFEWSKSSESEVPSYVKGYLISYEQANRLLLHLLQVLYH
jgi:hypothetical protein